MKKIITSAITIISLSLLSFSYAEDLMQVYLKALASDQTFQSAKATYLAATEAYPQARALLLPNVGLTADADYNRVTTLSPSARGGFSGTANFRSYSYTLSADQPVIDFANWFGLHVADYQVKEAAATYAAAAQDLILRVAQAYFNVLDAEDTLRFTKAEKRATERQLDQANQRYKVGLDAITSVYDAQASYDGIVAQEIAAKNAVVNNTEQLREITDVYYDHLAKLKKQMPLLTPEPNNVETWVNKSDRYNFTIQASRFAADSAREFIKQACSGHLPTLDLQGSYNRNKAGKTNVPGANDTRTEVVGLELNLPIFQGGLITSQTRQAQYDYQNAIAQMENTHRQVSVQLRQTYNSIIDGISKIKADKQAIISQESSVESTEAALKVGTRTIVDLLNAQQDLFEAQRILATDQYEYIINTLLFKQLAGTLTVNDLRAINTWLTGQAAKQKPANVYHAKTDVDKLKLLNKEKYHRKHEKSDKYKNKNQQKANTTPVKHITLGARKHPKKIHRNNNYAIQLMARDDKNDLNKYIKEQRIQGKTSIATTKVNNKTWYVLLYGNYASLGQADKALNILPKDLQKLHPWVRSFPKA